MFLLQDVCKESSHTIPGPSRITLKELLKKIEKLIDEAEKIVGVARIMENDAHIPNVTSNYIQKPTTALHQNKKTTTSNPPLKVTGRDMHREQLKSMLRAIEHDDTCYSVIGIHGIAGSGKTTLAQYVCKAEKNDTYFDLVMWIHVTQNFSVDTIYREMFEAASENKEPCPAYNSLDVLQIELMGVLHGKRFLLVLDDVWYNEYDHKDQELQQVLSPLEVGKRGSKILLTSRRALPGIGDVSCTPYPLPEMDSEDFFQLFMYYALGGTTIDARDARKLIGKQIAKKLKGSPLAATIVGQRLRTHKDVKYWIEFNAREHLDDVMDFLWWSYQHFDEEVRRCFAYCSIFPRRYKLKRDEIVKLWVIQGFINAPKGEEKEVAAQRYFDDLLSALFLRPLHDHNPDHYPSKYFAMHDLLHDLAKKVAGSECFTIKNGGTEVVPQDVRHLFVEISGEENISKVLELEKLRTLIITRTGLARKLTHVEEFESVFAKLPKLRVLIMEVTCWFQNYEKVIFVPISIGRLKCLRYFSFSVWHMNNVELNLPHTFSHLYHLKVLDVEFRKLTFSSREDTSNLINLQHVITYRKALDFPYIGRLESLQTLKHFTIKKEKGYELYQLKLLNKLRGTLNIYGLENVSSKHDAINAELHEKVYLIKLELIWSRHTGTSAEERYLQLEVLEALHPPMHLQGLVIHNYNGSCYPGWMMRGGSEVPMCLQDLMLVSCTKLASIPKHSVIFSHLHTLRIFACTWDSLPDNMENLELLVELQIDYCNYIRSLPEVLPPSLEKLRVMAGCYRIRSLPILPQSLVYFELSSFHREFIRSCETPGDRNYENIRHIPNKKIKYLHVSYSSCSKGKAFKPFVKLRLGCFTIFLSVVESIYLDCSSF